MVEMTLHASIRVQQRCIPPAVVDWLFEYGSSVRQDGAEVLHFDKAARGRLARDLGGTLVSRLGKLLNAYLVVSDDGQVVTAGYRHRRIRRR